MADLERELRALGEELRVPSGTSLPATVRARVAALPAPDRTGWWRRLAGRSSWQRGTLLAAVLVVAVASVAGAAALGLPGLRIVFGPGATSVASPTPSLVASPPQTAVAALGSELGLGEPIALEATHASVPFAVVVPTEPRLGALEVVWWDARLGDGQVALLWPATPALAAIDGSSVGAILHRDPGPHRRGLRPQGARPGYHGRAGRRGRRAGLLDLGRAARVPLRHPHRHRRPGQPARRRRHADVVARRHPLPTREPARTRRGDRGR